MKCVKLENSVSFLTSNFSKEKTRTLSRIELSHSRLTQTASSSSSNVVTQAGYSSVPLCSKQATKYNQQEHLGMYALHAFFEHLLQVMQKKWQLNTTSQTSMP